VQSAVTGTLTGAAGDAAVTMTQPKSGKYSIGDTLTFSGTNTGSDTTYLFIAGPNLDPKGAQIQSSHPGNAPVIDGDASTFLAASAGQDNQWSYTWNSQKVLIDAGMFEVFAASSPRDLPHINDTHYARVDFLMTRPANIESAEGNLSIPPSVVMKGDRITISGTAKGNPGPGVAIWIIGAPGSGTAGYADQVIVHPDATGAYSLDLDRATARLEEGRFHVVVQHPMQNNVFDIYLANVTAGNAQDAWVLNRMLKNGNNPDGTRVFKIRGAGSLQGNDAYEALVQVFEDPAVDDTIVIFPSTVNPTGSGDNVTGQQNQVPETQKPLTNGQNTKTAGSGTLLDLVWSFLAGVF
jgi:trimeric autotransporter adhesin